MKQYSREEAIALGFIGLGAVEDPLDLMAAASIAPIVIRYMVRNGQLEARFPGVDIETLFRTIEHSAIKLNWPFEVQQSIPLGERNAAVDAYLDELGNLAKQ